jgi:hypothetical protein
MATRSLSRKATVVEPPVLLLQQPARRPSPALPLAAFTRQASRQLFAGRQMRYQFEVAHSKSIAMSHDADLGHRRKR